MGHGDRRRRSFIDYKSIQIIQVLHTIINIQRQQTHFTTHYKHIDLEKKEVKFTGITCRPFPLSLLEGVFFLTTPYIEIICVYDRIGE